VGGRRSTALGGIVAVLICGATAAPAAAQQIQRCDASTREFASVSKPPRYAIGPQENVELTSERDGAAIDVALFRPQGLPAGERVPVIVNATPYHHAQPTLDVRRCKPMYVDPYVPQGYAVAFVAVRGTGNSGGCMDLFGPGERADLDQAVTWLAQREWSTGAVGMIGKSYEGATPWEVAAAGNPHLKTIVSMAGVPDVFELMYAGGNIDFRGPALLNDLYYGPSIVTYADGRPPERTAEVAACPDYVRGNEASLESSLTGEPDALGYWAERRYKQDVERRYRGSVLLAQGFEDLNVPPSNQFPWVDRLRAHGIPVKLWLGQFAHVNPDQAGGEADRDDWPDVVLAWFDRYLKGADVDTGPPVTVQDTEGKWRTAGVWPPRDQTRTYHLTADRTLATDPGEGTATHVLGPDPVHTQPGTVVLPETPLDAGCPAPTCTAFTLPAAAARLRFAGRPELVLRVTPTAPAGHVSAYLFAGAQRIGWGQADVRFPNDDLRREPVTPGTPMDLRLRFQPTDAVVPAGEPLTLILSQGAAYDRIPSLPTAPLVLESGGAASRLQLALVG
jgi:putative CocE/NonD family hydrolase